MTQGKRLSGAGRRPNPPEKQTTVRRVRYEDLPIVENAGELRELFIRWEAKVSAAGSSPRYERAKEMLSEIWEKIGHSY